jgi:protein SCO1/2
MSFPVPSARIHHAVPRRFGAAIAALTVAAAVLAACSSQETWHETDITGSLSALDLTMTSAEDSSTVTAADFAGKVVLLYFGYTQCPDVCPLTLSNLSRVLAQMGDKANDVEVLFVTVDPDRDTLPLLKDYTAAFGPQFVGLRGTPDQLAALAQRYRVSYSVTPATDTDPYTVTHGSAVYVFDQDGNIRLLMTSLASSDPGIDGAAADLTQLVDEANPPGFFQRLWQRL